MLGTKSELGVGSRTAALCSGPAQDDAAAHRGNGRVGASAHLTTGSSVDMRRRAVLCLVSVACALQAALCERRRRRIRLRPQSQSGGGCGPKWPGSLTHRHGWRTHERLCREARRDER